MQPTPINSISSEASPAVVESRPLRSADDEKALRSRFARGSLWALLGYGGSQVLRLGGNLILWRLLFAEAFGLMAIVNVFMQGLAMFSDVGIGPSIIQNEHGDDDDYLNTAWTIQALRGFALFAVAVIAAIPVARFYDEPELATLIPIVGAGSVLAGFNSTKLFTATRQIALGRLTIIDLVAQAVGLVVMVAWAVVSRSIWSLVVGSIVNNLVRLLLSHWLLPGIKNRFRWKLEYVHSLMHFGRWIFMSTLLTFMVMQSDRLIFGKLVSMSMLGVYSIATIWATFPTQIMGHVFQSVMFPMLSRLHNEGADVPAAYRRTRSLWLIAAGWLSACLISGGPSLVRFLYDVRATEAGWIVQVLSVGTWFLALEMSNGSALLAQGKPKWVAAGSAAKLAGMVVLIPIGMKLHGFEGAVFGFAASEVFRYCVSLMGAASSQLRGYRQDLMLTAMIVTTVMLGFLTRRIVARAGLAVIAVDHVKLGAFIEGLAIFLVISAVWGLVLLADRRRKLIAEAA